MQICAHFSLFFLYALLAHRYNALLAYRYANSVFLGSFTQLNPASPLIFAELNPASPLIFMGLNPATPLIFAELNPANPFYCQICIKKGTPVGLPSNAHRMLIECLSYAPYDVNPIYSPSLLSSASLFSRSRNHAAKVQKINELCKFKY